ncbi:MAG: nicotinamide-nucleotide amidohydrolase family protein [Candidatus Omnitrophica bacterium]|nr:nicotinamide-nucleotide amidohydrolase family protein [Candidatus Omnitrophota bacterium]
MKKGKICGYDDETFEGAVGKILTKKRLTIAVAESCTGGLLADRLTDISGSSKYFMSGVIAYSDESKANMLGVFPDSIKRYGAVSKQVALEMAKGIKHFACVDIGLSITGIAGPTGGTKAKPVGLVYVAFVTDKKRIVREFRFKGSRQEIKFQASQAALDIIRYNI